VPLPGALADKLQEAPAALLANGSSRIPGAPLAAT
jgi:hypothetical protein